MIRLLSLCGACLLPLLGCSTHATKPATGAYQTQAVTPAAEKAARYAVKAQSQQFPKQPITLLQILRTEKQVVAGVNYRLLLKVRVDGKERNAEAIVWEQSWRQPDRYRLTAWTWR